jgi:hypothetical protein
MRQFIVKFLITGIVLSIFLSACGVRPQYKTAKGKKKNRYYNSIQYHQEPFKAPNR